MRQRSVTVLHWPTPPEHDVLGMDMWHGYVDNKPWTGGVYQALPADVGLDIATMCALAEEDDR